MILCKRYLAFAGQNYYPSGGWGDLLGAFDSMDEAKAAVLAWPRERDLSSFGHVVDLLTETKLDMAVCDGEFLWGDEITAWERRKQAEYQQRMEAMRQRNMSLGAGHPALKPVEVEE